MLEVAICDDDKEDLDKAALMLDKILSEYQVQYQIRSFLSANELLNNNDKIDIGILDISMEELGGITLGRKLKEKNHDIKIIYITSYEEYMAQAINKVHAFSFLCKPINEEEMKTEEHSISPLLEKSNDEVFRAAMEQAKGVTSAFRDYSRIVVAGGTGEAWFEKIKDYLSGMKTITVVPGNVNDHLPFIYSNVRGYYMFRYMQNKR